MNCQDRVFPSWNRRGGCADNKKARSLRSGADGVVIMVNVYGVTLSGTDHPVCAFTRRLRSIFLMAQPPLLPEEGNTLPCDYSHRHTPMLQGFLTSGRRQVLAEFDVRSPGIGEKSNFDSRVRNLPRRGVELDARCLELFGKLVEVLHLEADVVERAAFRGLSLCITWRERDIEAVEIDAVRHSASRDCLALSGQTAEHFVVPGLNGRNVGCGKKHVNVVHSDRTGQGRIAKHLHADSVRSLDVSLVWIGGANRVVDIGGFPPGACSINVFQNETEVVDYGTRRRSGGLALLQHHEHAGELNHREWAVLDEGASQHFGPEPFMSIDVLHRQVDVTQPDAQVIGGLSQLCECHGREQNTAGQNDREN